MRREQQLDAKKSSRTRGSLKHNKCTCGMSVLAMEQKTILNRLKFMKFPKVLDQRARLPKLAKIEFPIKVHDRDTMDQILKPRWTYWICT